MTKPEKYRTHQLIPYSTVHNKSGAVHSVRYRTYSGHPVHYQLDFELRPDIWGYLLSPYHKHLDFFGLELRIIKVHTHTGYFRKVYRSLQVRVPRNILKYLSIQKLPQKRSHQLSN